jgi:serine/threonine protein phosphatase PrpC
MRSSFVLANEKIYEDRLKNPDRNNMACVLTLAIADMEQNQFHYAHVGDTRLYLFRDHSLVKVTRDHSFVGFLEDNKRISEEEAMSHPKRNEINKALGYDPNMAGVADYIESGSSPFLPGDLLMLCSDGLTDLVDNSTMGAILNTDISLRDRVKQLIDAANHAGGKDNISVVLVYNNKKAARQKATKPVLIKKNEITAKQTEPVKTVTQHERKNRGNGLVIFLFLLCLLLGALAYFFWKQNSKVQSTAVAQTRPVGRNVSEQRLHDSLEVSPFLFLDSSYGNSISVTDTIVVQTDSLYISGNNIRLVSDSAYKGPLFVTAPNCRYISLENLVIENFVIGLIAKSQALRLKNVRFINCRVPVQYDFYLPLNQPVSGMLVDTLLFKPDSASKNRQ